MIRRSICLIDDDEWFRDMFCQYMVCAFKNAQISSETFEKWKSGENSTNPEEYLKYDFYIFGGAGTEYLKEEKVAAVAERSIFLFRCEEEAEAVRQIFPDALISFKFISAAKLAMHINLAVYGHRTEGGAASRGGRFFVISVTSSAGGVGKTSFSLVLARLIQQKRNREVLVVSTSLLYDLKRYFPMESGETYKTLDEYIYRLFAGEHPEQSIASYLVRDRFGVSSFNIGRNISEIASLDAEEMGRLMGSLEDSSVFDTVVFDLDNSNDAVTAAVASRSDALAVLSLPEDEEDGLAESWSEQIVRNSESEPAEVWKIINMQGREEEMLSFYDGRDAEAEGRTAGGADGMKIPYDPHSFYRSEGLKQISMTGSFAAAVDHILKEVMPVV